MMLGQKINNNQLSANQNWNLHMFCTHLGLIEVNYDTNYCKQKMDFVIHKNCQEYSYSVTELNNSCTK